MNPTEDSTNDKQKIKHIRKEQMRMVEECSKLSFDEVHDKFNQALDLLGDEEREKALEKFKAKHNGSCNMSMVIDDIRSMTEQAQLQAEEEFQVRCENEERGINDEDIDPYGDGEQAQLFGVEAMTLQAQTIKLMDYDHSSNHKLSKWSKACYYGNLVEVKKFLDDAQTADDKKKLLEKRESMMRFSGVFHVVCGAWSNPSDNHVKIVKLLIENGARFNAKDVGGSTALHHCMSQWGNSCTLGIAKVLVANGIDVNAKNRYGATALFEPCVTLNYEFVEFLVCNRCNPIHKESFGVSCYNYAAMNPKLRSIFNKGTRRQAELDRLKLQFGNQTPDTCCFCQSKSQRLKKCSGCFSVAYCTQDCQLQDWKSHSSICKTRRQFNESSAECCASCKSTEGSMKKCSACLLVGYCSIECQKKDWKKHKSACKAKQIENKENSQILVFHPVSDAFGKGETVAFNEKKKKVQPLFDGKQKFTGVEKAMKIKVQVIYDTTGVRSDYPMTVYDKVRSYQTSILPKDDHYKELYKLITTKGYGGIKMYFTALLRKNSDLHINIGQSYPETW